MKKIFFIIFIITLYIKPIISCTIEVTDFQIVTYEVNQNLSKEVKLDLLYGISRFLSSFKKENISFTIIDTIEIKDSELINLAKEVPNLSYISKYKILNYLKNEGYNINYISNPIILDELYNKFNIDFILNAKTEEYLYSYYFFKDKKNKDLYKKTKEQTITMKIRVLDAKKGIIKAIDKIYARAEENEMYFLTNNKKDVVESFNSFINLPEKYYKYKSKHPDKGLKGIKYLECK